MNSDFEENHTDKDILRLVAKKHRGGYVSTTEMYADKIYSLMKRPVTCGDIETLMCVKCGVKISGNQAGKALQAMARVGLVRMAEQRSQLKIWERAADMERRKAKRAVKGRAKA